MQLLVVLWFALALVRSLAVGPTHSTWTQKLPESLFASQKLANDRLASLQNLDYLAACKTLEVFWTRNIDYA